MRIEAGRREGEQRQAGGRGGRTEAGRREGRENRGRGGIIEAGRREGRENRGRQEGGQSNSANAVHQGSSAG